MLDSLFDQIVHCSMLGSAAIVLVVLIRWLGGRWISPSVRHALWAAAALLLFAPQLPDLGLGLRPPAKPVLIKRITARSSVSGGTPIIQQTVVPFVKAEAIQMNHGPAVPKRAGSLAMLWSGGALLVLGGWLLSYGMLRRRVRRLETAVPEELTALLASCARTMRLTRTPQLRVTSAVRAPAVMGLLQPEILVPPSIATTLEASELRMVLMHECAHVRRHDLTTHWVSMLLLALHWFNPLCWLAMRMLHADREAACDAAVLAACSDSDHRSAYGHTLLKLGSAAMPGLRFDSLVGVLGSVDRLRKRIVEIARFGSSSRSAGRSAMAMAVLGVVSLAVAAAEPPRPKPVVTMLDNSASPAVRPPVEPGPAPGTATPLAPPASTELLQRSYKVPPNFFASMASEDARPKDPFAPNPVVAAATYNRTSAQEMLARRQVTFPEGSSLFYNPTSSLLIVKNTIENLERIRKLVAKSFEPQVIIHTSTRLAVFDDSMRTRVADLAAFMTTISGGRLLQWASFQEREAQSKASSDEATPAFAVQLTGPQFEQAVRLLMKAAKGDDKALAASTEGVTAHLDRIISLPTVTQRTGPPARVEVVREFIHPTQYGVASEKDRTLTPTTFEMQQIGASIDLSHSLKESRSAVDLAYKATLSGLVEMRDFKSDSGDKLSVPLFETRSTSGKAALPDGGTVAILMNEAPVARLLTDSAAGVDGMKSVSRPVIVFLTAVLLDDKGNKLNPGQKQ